MSVGESLSIASVAGLICSVGSDCHFERTIGVLQFGHVDLRLAFSADIDERNFRSERDDSAFDCLAAREVSSLL